MLFKAHCNHALSRRRLLTKTLRVVKITAILLFVACIQVSANGFSQGITLSVKNVRLEKIFQEVKKQTGYSFIYTRELLQQTDNITLEVTNASIEQVLGSCFKAQPLTYTIEKKFIIIKLKPTPVPLIDSSKGTTGLINISGRIFDEKGYPMVAVTINVKD